MGGMKPLGSLLAGSTGPNTQNPTDGDRAPWTAPVDDADFYARVREHAGDRVDTSDVADLVEAPSCEACSGSGYVVRRARGATVLEDAGKVRPCPRCAAERRRINFERIGLKSILTFGDWIDVEAMRPARAACDELIMGKKRWAALIAAGVGRGKTMLAKATVHAWVLAGKGNALFRTAPELFEEMREAYDPASTWSLNALVELYETRDLLVIDDLGSEYHRPTAGDAVDWSDEKLFRIIDTRWQKKRRTLITTNLAPDDPRIPARVRSRLAGCEIVVTGGEDYRRNQ